MGYKVSFSCEGNFYVINKIWSIFSQCKSFRLENGVTGNSTPCNFHRNKLYVPKKNFQVFFLYCRILFKCCFMFFFWFRRNPRVTIHKRISPRIRLQFFGCTSYLHCRVGELIDPISRLIVVHWVLPPRIIVSQRVFFTTKRHNDYL